MKQFFKMFFASLLALIIGSVILVGIVIGIGITIGDAFEKRNDKKASDKAIIKLDLSNLAGERSNENTDKYTVLIAGKNYSPGLYEALEAIKDAATDDGIKAIYLKLDGFNDGWATAEQLREGLQYFKSKNKKVYAYGEVINQKDYYIASVANTIYLCPTGNLEFKGLASQLTFFKGTFEKLGVEPEIFYAGKFKSFTEPFRAKEMSEPNRLQIAAIHNAIWDKIVKATADKTKADSATIDGWAQNGTIAFPQDALAYKMVDSLGYEGELFAKIRKEQNLDDYPNDGEELPTQTLATYTDEHRGGGGNDDEIALLIAEGDIVDGRGTSAQIASEDYVDIIRELRDNDNLKAIVFRINSGGGSALASEVILHELNALKAEKNIPIIVSMGDVAASGGYYIASGADSIFALPNTITGSIGVFTMLFNLGPLAQDKLGITFDVQKNAPSADFPTASRSATAQEAQRTQASVDTIYQTFLRRVATGRKMSVADVDSIAQGRVWSGVAAQRLGLVDGLGGLDRAFKAAKKMANLEDYSVSIYPRPSDALKERLEQLMGSASTVAQIKEGLNLLDIPEVKMLMMLEQWKKNRGRVQAYMPFSMEVK